MKRFLLTVTGLLVLQILFAQTAPVAVNDTFTTNKNISISLPVTANDYDVNGDPLTVSILYSSVHGSATVNGNQIVYVPDMNFVGSDSVTYIICDTTNLCDTAVVYIYVTGADNAPVALNDTFTVAENSVTFIPVASNDYDPDGDPLTITILVNAQHGTTTITNGTQIIYTPTPFFFGADSFRYVICDTSGLCDTATCFIFVTGTNMPPVAAPDNYIFEDTLNATVLNVLANDHDPENDSIFVSAVIDLDSNNNLGFLSIVPVTGQVVFVRTALACGNETFAYVVCDLAGCDTGLVTITINCPDKVFLPQGFSPDGDGKNDQLVFTGLEYFAPAAIKVYNRYGTSVYDNADYKNNWDGINTDNKPLPDGTYFYVLELSDKRKYNSYLIINR